MQKIKRNVRPVEIPSIKKNFPGNKYKESFAVMQYCSAFKGMNVVETRQCLVCTIYCI